MRNSNTLILCVIFEMYHLPDINIQHFGHGRNIYFHCRTNYKFTLKIPNETICPVYIWLDIPPIIN